LTAFSRTDRVMVSPRHLAGTGLDRVGDALGPLIHQFGWSADHDAATGRVRVHSPDHSLKVAFDPTDFDGTWWTITHHEPYWAAEFTRQTPAEAVAAVTQCLPQMLGDQRHSERIHLTRLSIADIATLNHWTASPDGSEFTSADRYCTLRHTLDAETSYAVHNSIHGGFDTEWHANFTIDAPEQVVAQFFAHLSTAEPVEREYREIPYLARDLGDALITPVRGASVNSHAHHHAAQAGRALAARRR